MRYLLAVSVLACGACAALSRGMVRSGDFNASAPQELPQCAVGCLEQLLPPLNCQVDSPCFCENSSLAADYAACVNNGCASTDWLDARSFQAETCSLPVRNRANITRGVNFALLGLVIVFVGLRVVSRTHLLNGRGFRWDDFVVGLCFAVEIPLHASLELATQNGLGQDTYVLSVSQITQVLKWSYVGGILFQSVVMLSKIAIVLLYLRIWTTDSTKQVLRIKCWIMIAVLATTVLAFDLALIFQCSPVKFAWTSFESGRGTCVEREPLLYTFAALNIFFNFVVFFLPIHSLGKLDIPWQKKAGVYTVFVLGFVATATSAIRLQYLVRLKGNPAWNLQYIFMWSVIEASVSLLCACVPSVTGLLQRCAGTEPFSSSDDLVGAGSVTTQKTLLRRGNNFYTVDRPSAEIGMADVHEELSDLEKAPKDIQALDEAALESTSRVMEHSEQETEVNSPDSRFSDVPIFNEAEDERPRFATTTLEYTSRPRSHQFRNQATDMAALLYNSKVTGRPKKVKISHDPPSEPAEARLTYRDEYNILHEVTVTDIPQSRIGPFHSGHGVRPTILRAITEADSRRTSKYLSGEYSSPVHPPASPGFRLDDSAVTEAGYRYPQMVSASSQTDLYEPHNLSPIHSHCSSPAGRRLGDSNRPSLGSRSTSTQTDEQTLSSFASRTSSPAANPMLMSPIVLSRTVSAHTQDSEALPSPLVPSSGVASPGTLSVEGLNETPATQGRHFTTATTQVDESDAPPLSPKVLYNQFPSESSLERVPSPPVISKHTSTQTIDSDLPLASPLSLASPLYSPVNSPSEKSLVGLASLPSVSLTAETQTDESESSPASPISSRRSSSTQTIGFLGLDSKRRLGI